MKTAYLIMAIVCIGLQTFHSWYCIDTFNHLPEKWMRRMQNVLFCAVIGVLIMLFVLDGRIWLAVVGAIIEILFNIYYYRNEDIDKRTAKAKREQWLKWWVMCWVFPVGIAVCSHLAFAP